MPYYMIQVAYTAEAWAAQIQDPVDRIEILRPVVEGLGGRIVNRWFSLGDYDVVLIIEMPDNTSASAFAISASAGGGPKSTKITPLMTAEENLEALKQARGSGYSPPGS